MARTYSGSHISDCFMTASWKLTAGITAAAGISAELGIPLTHRGLATSCAFITGHAREGGQESLDISVTAAVNDNTTLIVYMGLNTLPALLSRLAEGGLPANTPCAAIERGTTFDQRGVYSAMCTLTKVSPSQPPQTGINSTSGLFCCSNCSRLETTMDRMFDM